jgi:hypothetical protein
MSKSFVLDLLLFLKHFPGFRVNFIPCKPGRTEGCNGAAVAIPDTDRRSFPTMIPVGAQSILVIMERTVHPYALRREPQSN